MGLDPVSLGASIATNFATDILKHYAQRLDGTLVGKVLKELGLIEENQLDRLFEVFKGSLLLFFQNHPEYNVDAVESFFCDPLIIQQIWRHLLNLQPLDQAEIETALSRHVKSDIVIMTSMQQIGGQPEQIIPEFLQCYRFILKQQLEPAERAIFLTVLESAKTVREEIQASEERVKMFMSETAHQQTQALRNTPPVLNPGQSVGHYRIQQHLADGRFGTLYRVEDQAHGTQVVLKVISVPPEMRLKQDVFFVGEGLKALLHPFILPTLDIQLDATFPYVVTAYAEGGTLLERLHQHAPQILPTSEAMEIITQLGQALSYLHQQHIIHRVLQPACILFNQAGQIQLTGFDLAITEARSRHRILADLAGVDGYMAPEQLRGVVSTKSDQYALGCIAYELLTGHVPFSVTPDPATPPHEMKIPAAPNRINPHVTAQAGRAVLKALSLKAGQRYENVEAFLVDITKH